jgi:hypothetical protein
MQRLKKYNKHTPERIEEWVEPEDDCYYIFTHTIPGTDIMFYADYGINLFDIPIILISKSKANNFQDMINPEWKAIVEEYGNPDINIIKEKISLEEAKTIKEEIIQKHNLEKYYTVKKKKSKLSPVSRYSLEGIWEKDYPSAASTEADGFQACSVIMCCNPIKYPNKHHKGKIWKYTFR